VLLLVMHSISTGRSNYSPLNPQQDLPLPQAAKRKLAIAIPVEVDVRIMIGIPHGSNSCNNRYSREVQHGKCSKHSWGIR
jgi:hypothetical protein